MRTLIQHVSKADVTVDKQVVDQIEHGLLILLGVGQSDCEAQVRQLTDFIGQLRIFEDVDGKMNRSLFRYLFLEMPSFNIIVMMALDAEIV